ncbi:MAG: glutamate-cysteine ligase family protein [Patescibacteria group bacterium]
MIWFFVFVAVCAATWFFLVAYQYLKRFNFDPSKCGWLGCELELFVVDLASGKVVARAAEIINAVSAPWCKPELGATQVEITTDTLPTAEAIVSQLMSRLRTVRQVARELGLGLVAMEYAPYDIPIDAFPSPRYERIANQMSEYRRRAAMRLAALHFHHGCGSWSDAFRVHNAFVRKISCSMIRGDHSRGARHATFQTFHATIMPMRIWNRFFFVVRAIVRGYLKDPKLDWSWERISVHGTVEGRSYGSIDDPDEILDLLRWRVKVSGLPIPSAVQQHDIPSREYARAALS